jgi:predicted RNA-binding Zn-ribbon protein involved in translation (DUF1610 family)
MAASHHGVDFDSTFQGRLFAISVMTCIALSILLGSLVFLRTGAEYEYPIWFLILSFSITASAVVSAIACPRPVRGIIHQYTCSSCGYDMRGHRQMHRRCPECGKLASNSHKRPMEAQSTWILCPAILYVMAGLSCLYAIYCLAIIFVGPGDT